MELEKTVEPIQMNEPTTIMQQNYEVQTEHPYGSQQDAKALGMSEADFDKGMANLAAQLGLEPKKAAEPKPEQTTVEAAVPEPVTVPEKFKTDEGKVDVEKVEKSLTAAEKAIAAEKMVEDYLNKERELRKLQATNQQAAKQIEPVVPQTPAPAQANSIPSLAGITPQMVAEAIKQPGSSMELVMLQLASIAQENARVQARAEIEGQLLSLQGRVDGDARKNEIQAIAKSNPDLLTPDVMAAVLEIRQANPHLNHAAEPFREALKIYLGEQALKTRLNPQGSVPTPVALTVTAPAAPAKAANRGVTQSVVDWNDRASVDRYFTANNVPLDKQIQILRKVYLKGGK